MSTNHIILRVHVNAAQMATQLPEAKRAGARVLPDEATERMDYRRVILTLPQKYLVVWNISNPRVLYGHICAHRRMP